MSRVAAIFLLCACSEPVVEMHLVLPSNTTTPMPLLDTSCVTAVEVHAIGANYPADARDLTTSCQEFKPAATYTDVAATIRGKFELNIPAGGLSGLEMFGWSGQQPCAMQQMFQTPDLIFWADANYVGAQQIDLKLQPNLGCQRDTVKVRMVDMIGLAIAGTANTANCTAAEIPDTAGNAGVGSGTIIPREFEGNLQFFGNTEGNNQVNGLSTFQTPDIPGPKTCFAIDAGWDGGGATSCIVGGPPVCAGAGETEAAVLPQAVVNAAINLDTSLAGMWSGIVVGGVWSGTAKTPVSGATVTVDPSQGIIVYVDPVGVTGLKKSASQSATGASGLFVLYTNTVPSVTVMGPSGSPRMVTMSSPYDRVGASLISL